MTGLEVPYLIFYQTENSFHATIGFYPEQDLSGAMKVITSALNYYLSTGQSELVESKLEEIAEQHQNLEGLAEDIRPRIDKYRGHFNIYNGPRRETRLTLEASGKSAVPLAPEDELYFLELLGINI